MVLMIALAIVSDVILAVELGALSKEVENKIFSEEWCIHVD